MAKLETVFTNHLEKIEQSLDKAIRMDFSQEWQNNAFGKLPEAVTKSFIQNLIEPNKNLITLGGKRWRPLLMMLCYQMAAAKNKPLVNIEQAYDFTQLVEFVHTASLIHDDIEDGADLRRGKPAAHITYGLDTSLNAASWLYFAAPICINNSTLTQESKLLLYQVYTEELRRLHLGQAMDIYWHRNPAVFPLQAEYNSMVKCKTGTLASLAAKMGLLLGGASKEDSDKVGEIAANIGIGFQIIDDVQNLTIGNPGKKRGDDIVEGKKSLPVILHVSKMPEDKDAIATAMERASKEGIESDSVELCIKILEKSGCIQEAAKMGIDYIKENCALLQSDLITQLFEKMIPEVFK